VTPGAGLAGVEIEFVGSFPDPLVRLTPPLPEVAFIGRSNVGKSSLLNALVGRRSLARVSATPGKTTLLNAYRLPRFYLVDLPGYGFARASKVERERHRTLIDRFLRERASLTGVAWLLDSRHEPSKNDQEIQRLLIESGRPDQGGQARPGSAAGTCESDRQGAGAAGGPGAAHQCPHRARHRRLG
jgi:ribosome biogenesis GTP-binding protein YsxC/EngB